MWNYKPQIRQNTNIIEIYQSQITLYLEIIYSFTGVVECLSRQQTTNYKQNFVANRGK